MSHRHYRVNSTLLRLIVFSQLVAILLTGVIAAKPVVEKQPSTQSVNASTDIHHSNQLAAGLGDTSPTENTASSEPVTPSGEQCWLLAPVLTPESLRSIRFISPELTFGSIESARFSLPVETIRSTLGDISPLLPKRFALVGQRPSGTS